MVQVRHQREHAHREQTGAANAPRSAAGGTAEDEIGRRRCPRRKRRRLVEVVDRAMRDGEAALDHGEVCRARGQRAKNNSHSHPGGNPFATGKPNTSSDAVKRDGEQKKMPVSEPVHGERLNHDTRRASGNSADLRLRRQNGSGFEVFIAGIIFDRNSPVRFHQLMSAKTRAKTTGHGVVTRRGQSIVGQTRASCQNIHTIQTLGRPI